MGTNSHPRTTTNIRACSQDKISWISLLSLYSTKTIYQTKLQIETTETTQTWALWGCDGCCSILCLTLENLGMKSWPRDLSCTMETELHAQFPKEAPMRTHFGEKLLISARMFAFQYQNATLPAMLAYSSCPQSMLLKCNQPISPQFLGNIKEGLIKSNDWDPFPSCSIPGTVRLPFRISCAAMVSRDTSNHRYGVKKHFWYLFSFFLHWASVRCLCFTRHSVLQRSHTLYNMYHKHLVQDLVFPHYHCSVYFEWPCAFCEL